MKKSKKSGSGLAVLGYFVWWSMEEVKVRREELDKLVDGSELDVPLLKLCERTAFLEAVRFVKAKSHTNKLLIRNLSKSKDEHVFGLVDEDVDEEHQKLGYTHSANLCYNQETHDITCNNSHRAFDQVKEKYNENLEWVNSYELRRFTMKILDGWRNISVRDKGGVYYIDVKYEEDLEKLADMLNKINGVDFEIIPLPDVERSKKAIYKAYTADLQHRIQRFNEQIENDKFTSEKGWNNALTKFKELREEVSFYADRLSFTAKDLEKDIVELQKKVKSKLVD